MTWIDAENYCLSTYNSHLLSIHDSITFARIRAQIHAIDQDASNFWIGLINKNPFNQIPDYQWSDNSPFDYGTDLSGGVYPWFDERPETPSIATKVRLWGGSAAHLWDDVEDINNNHEYFWICNDVNLSPNITALEAITSRNPLPTTTTMPATVYQTENLSISIHPVIPNQVNNESVIDPAMDLFWKFVVILVLMFSCCVILWMYHLYKIKMVEAKLWRKQTKMKQMHSQSISIVQEKVVSPMHTTTLNIPKRLSISTKNSRKNTLERVKINDDDYDEEDIEETQEEEEEISEIDTDNDDECNDGDDASSESEGGHHRGHDLSTITLTNVPTTINTGSNATWDTSTYTDTKTTNRDSYDLGIVRRVFSPCSPVPTPFVNHTANTPHDKISTATITTISDKTKKANLMSPEPPNLVDIPDHDLITLDREPSFNDGGDSTDYDNKNKRNKNNKNKKRDIKYRERKPIKEKKFRHQQSVETDFFSIDHEVGSQSQSKSKSKSKSRSKSESKMHSMRIQISAPDIPIRHSNNSNNNITLTLHRHHSLQHYPQHHNHHNNHHHQELVAIPSDNSTHPYLVATPSTYTDNINPLLQTEGSPTADDTANNLRCGDDHGSSLPFIGNVTSNTLTYPGHAGANNSRLSSPTVEYHGGPLIVRKPTISPVEQEYNHNNHAHHNNLNPHRNRNRSSDVSMVFDIQNRDTLIKDLTSIIADAGHEFYRRFTMNESDLKQQEEHKGPPDIPPKEMYNIGRKLAEKFVMKKLNGNSDENDIDIDNDENHDGESQETDESIHDAMEWDDHQCAMTNTSSMHGTCDAISMTLKSKLRSFDKAYNDDEKTKLNQNDDSYEDMEETEDDETDIDERTTHTKTHSDNFSKGQRDKMGITNKRTISRNESRYSRYSAGTKVVLPMMRLSTTNND